MKRLILALSIINFSLIGASQDFDKSRMDQFFELIELENQGMGSIALTHKGSVIYQKAIGKISIEEQTPADINSKYRIGSISKTFTAAIIMQLAEEGKLSLDTKLSAYYPELPNADKITIEDMLRHRSGLFNFTTSSDFLDWMEKPHTHDQLLDLFKEKGTVFEPDSKYEYSNTNYVLLSYIAEKIDKQGFSTILTNRITDRINLKDTYYGGKISTAHNEAQSYDRANPWQTSTESHMSIPSGAGAIVSTPSDVNVFFYALFNGKIVSQESLDKMTKMVDNYGYGLFQFPFYGKRAFGHTGGIDAFRSMAGYFPEEDLAITYTSNAANFEVNNIMIGALSIYFGREYDFPSFEPALTVSEDKLNQYLGTYASSEFPLKLVISKNGAILMGQATGQPAFNLEAYEEHKFKFDQAGLKLEFFPEENRMLLKQGGAQYEFSKE